MGQTTAEVARRRASRSAGRRLARSVPARSAGRATDAPLFPNVDELRWRRPPAGFESLAKELGEPKLWKRACTVAESPPQAEDPLAVAVSRAEAPQKLQEALTYMQFSLRSLLLLTVAVCVSLALASLEFVTGGVILLVIVAAASFMLPPDTKRGAVYGALAGVFVAYLALKWSIELGLLTDPGVPHPFAHTALLFAWRPLVLHGGSLVGGTLGVCFITWLEQRDARRAAAKRAALTEDSAT